MNKKNKVEKMLHGLNCSKGFTCFISGQEDLCRAEDIGLDSYLVCLNIIRENVHSLLQRMETCHFCQCPLRVYIAKKMKIWVCPAFLRMSLVEGKLNDLV